MIDPEDKDYVCTLDAKSLEKAKKELNEDENDRLAAVSALRQWINSQPHIRMHTDTSTMLQILRTKKFSQLESRKMVENMLQMRLIEPKWFKDCDPADPKIQKILRIGFCLPLPGRDENGQKIVILRRGIIDPSSKEYTADDMIRAQMVFGVYINLDEMTQVNGHASISDMTGFTMKHHNMVPLEQMRKIMKLWLGNVPGRFKAFHMYNAGSLMDFLMVFAKSVFPKKYMDRIILHGDNLESLYKHVPMRLLPEEYLPDDYEGPHNGSIQKLTDDFAEAVCQEPFRSAMRDATSSKYGIDEDKRPKEKAPTSSFRKLNID